MKRLTFFLCFLILTTGIFAKGNIYRPISKKSYLLGKFNPAKHPKFIALRKVGIKTNKSRKIYVRKEVAEALLKAMKAFKKAHPEIPFFVVSGTRSYWQQKYIWEHKWKRRSNRKLKPYKRALKILLFSSMPGTSRHHWGTDIDLNNLNNSYFRKGKGKIFFKWMKKNMSKYGFYLVYTPGRKRGYQEESWHWSYLPLSRKMLKDWNKLYANNPDKINRGRGFLGSKNQKIIRLAPIYVNSINKECK